MKVVRTLLTLALCVPVQTFHTIAHAGEVPADRVPTITVKDLGSYGDNLTVPEAINNRGEIAVNAWDNQGWSGAIYWSARTGFVEATPGLNSVAFDINDHGQLVGIYNESGDSQTRGFVWSARDSSLTDLGAFAPWDINNRGVMFGQCWEPATPEVPHFCLNDRGEFYPLPAEAAQPRHINDRGEVVGYLTTEAGQLRPFTWSRRSGLIILEVPPGVVSGLGEAMNNRGAVLGSTTDDPDSGLYMVTVWNPKGEAETLPTSSTGFISAINSKGWMLQMNNRLWMGPSGPLLLPDPPGLDSGWQPVVMNLNDRGEIVGWSVVNGETHAVLWTVK